MNKCRVFTGAAAATGMLLLILDTKTALAGAADGLTLCLRTVIPSLFPFFFLSVLLTGALLGSGMPILRPVSRFLGIPEGTESILAAGFLGGYPVGAQAIGAAAETGQLSKADARRMIAFCNNAGPAFLFGIGTSLFPLNWMPWALWGIHILSAAMVAMILPGKSKNRIPIRSVKPPSLTSAMFSALRIMAGVCGWIVLFRVVIAFLGRWFGWMLPDICRILLSGILELSNGCIGLTAVENVGLRFVIFSGFLAFGGICVSFQTMTAAKNVDLGLYFPGKVLQTVLSIAFSALIQLRLPEDLVWPVSPWMPIGMLAFVSIPLFLLKKRNKSGNPASVGV